MKQPIVLFLLLFCIGCKSTQTISPSKSNENPSGALSNEISVENTRQILTDLSADDMEGRKPGSEGIEKAAKYIESFLETVGIEPYFNTSYRDTFLVEGTETYNLVGLIEAERETNEFILLGAHYDHIGTESSESDSVFNGANDNASGVTAVLQIAKQLSQQNLDKNVLVALFSGEESGLIGSKHLAQRLKSENIDLDYVINFEMIGNALTSGKDKVYITGFNKSNFSEAVNEVLGREFISFLEEEEQYKLFFRSDNYPFYEQFQIPAHTISSFDFKNNPYYHKVQDEADQLDPAHMAAIIKSSTEAVLKLLEQDKSIVLKEGSEN